MSNGILFQAFEWELSAAGDHYLTLIDKRDELVALGITAIWLPPAYKGSGDLDVGYTAYDIWDLGEYDQKGTVKTKYGSKEELQRCIWHYGEKGISIYADIVYNHKGSADFSETFYAVKVNSDNREIEESDPYEIEGWTGFNFPGRQKQRSDFVWHHYHFSGVDYDQRNDESGIFRIEGENKYWNDNTDLEKGNFDYLMNADIDHDHPEVRAELLKASRFMIEEMGYRGFRYDALKHIASDFIDEHTQILKQDYPEHYFLGEYWSSDLGTLQHYLQATQYAIDLFDVPLHFNMVNASRDPNYDMRAIFDNSLVQNHPSYAVTFVDNHDTQPSQSLDSRVERWFKEIAYALILLRKDGYPCIFWGDLYGLMGGDYAGIYEQIKIMCRLREQFVYGEQHDYFVTESKIGWVLMGDRDHPGKLVVLISTGDKDEHAMYVGEDQAGKTYCDQSGKNQSVTIGQDGKGLFTVAPGAVTYWTAACSTSTSDD